MNVLDDERALQLMTPRKPRSSWTRLNRQRAQDMEDAGLMTDAGRRAVARPKQNGSWTIYDAVEDLVEPPELAAALDGDPAARRHWDGFPPSARKAMLWWVISATKDDTRRRRIATIAAKAVERRTRARGDRDRHRQRPSRARRRSELFDHAELAHAVDGLAA